MTNEIQNQKSKIRVIVALIFLPLILTACSHKPPVEVTKKLEPVTLQWWGVTEDESAMQGLLSRYAARMPQVRIEYTRFPYDEYETRLLEAWATGTGPDIYALHNTWVDKYESKLVPMPEVVQVVRKIGGGGFGSKEKIQAFTERTIGAVGVRNAFVDQVVRDALVTVEGSSRVLALPLSFDVLALAYNRDLLNRAGIAGPPATWEEFVAATKKLTVYNKDGEVEVAGAAIGRGENVERAADILALLMMQNGTEMIDHDRRSVKFNQRLGTGYEPGIRALQFYSDFANPAKEVFSWTAKMPSALEALASGRAAMAFTYAWQVPTLRARAPQLAITLAPAPQLPPNPAINFASYWLSGVSFQSKHADLAWDVLQTLTRREHIEGYLQGLKRPTALRSLIEVQKQDPDLAPFAEGILTAQSWYRGKNAPAVEAAFRTMIEGMNRGEAKPQDLLNFAAAQVARTL